MNRSLSTCCFFGHRKIVETDKIANKLKESIERLITESKVDTFLFGSKSQFDKLCHSIVTQLKEKYPHTRRIYVRAEFPYINKDYTMYLLKSFENTYYPQKIINAGKAVYVERNYEMIDNSSYCIVYFNENYTPMMRKRNKKAITNYEPKSGTKIAFEYAVKKEKKIINLFEE